MLYGSFFRAFIRSRVVRLAPPHLRTSPPLTLHVGAILEPDRRVNSPQTEFPYPKDRDVPKVMSYQV